MQVGAFMRLMERSWKLKILLPYVSASKIQNDRAGFYSDDSLIGGKVPDTPARPVFVSSHAKGKANIYLTHSLTACEAQNKLRMIRL